MGASLCSFSRSTSSSRKSLEQRPLGDRDQRASRGRRRLLLAQVDADVLQ